MSEVRERKLPTIYLHTDDDNREATSRADGASLALGSTEYRERMFDLQGLDEFEQDEQRLDGAGLRKADAVSKFDEHNAAYRQRVGSHAGDLQQQLADENYGRFTTGEWLVDKEIRKSLAAEQAAKSAEKAAAKTETKEDDKYVARKLPKKLEEAVYDRSKEADDIYPGMKTLGKYM